ncbi:MAG: SpoIIE family protein phosphatase [Flavobacteriales bacterium]|nr:SpoIIE family protein phosphatase [Flavobacteriales bacterium]
MSEVNWKQEIDETAYRYHKIALWIAVVFDLLFFVPDYFNIPEYWVEFLTFRVAVAFICLIVVLFHKKLKISTQLMGALPVFLISVQNAYMWSVMGVEDFQKHTFSYMALFIGAGMFVFYHWYYSLVIIIIDIVANVFFLSVNSTLSVEEILTSGGLLTASIAIFSALLIRMRINLTKKEIVSRLKLEESKFEIEEKNKEILDSINYAKRIQFALLPPKNVFKELFPNSFLIYKPKDIVSGDFYWGTRLSTTIDNADGNESLVVFCVADCTGHGVPGAFMSLIGIKILNQSIKMNDVNSPAQALDYLNEQVYNTINKHSSKESVVRDGMDIAFCAINFKTLNLSYSGANNSLYIIRKGELIELKADKQPIGSYENQQPFTNHQIQLEKGDMVYAFSDGYADQFGGVDGKKMKSKRFKEKLMECSNMDVEKQESFLSEYFENWKGNLEQLDDVCVIGVKI